MTRRASGWSTWSPHCSARSTCARASWSAGQQRRLGRALVERAQDRARAEHLRRRPRRSTPGTLQPPKRSALDGPVQRPGSSSTRRTATPLSSQRPLDGGARMRGGNGVEHGGHGAREHNPAAMLLVVDVGNTQTHFGTFRRRRAGRALALRDRARVDRRRARRRAAQPARAARPALRRPRRVDRLLDRPAAAPRVDRDGRALPRPRDAGRRPGLRTGMPIRMDNPRELGADRLVNAVAAYERSAARAWSSTSARRSPSTSSPPAASTSAASSPRASRSRWRR